MDIIGFFDSEKRPRLTIELRSQSNFILVNALLDSGADISIIPRKVGIELGLKLPRKTEGFSVGVGGVSPNMVVELKLKINGIALEIPFVWLYHETDVPVILGRKGVFDFFDIEFKQREKKIILRR